MDGHRSGPLLRDPYGVVLFRGPPFGLLGGPKKRHTHMPQCRECEEVIPLALPWPPHRLTCRAGQGLPAGRVLILGPVALQRQTPLHCPCLGFKSTSRGNVSLVVSNTASKGPEIAYSVLRHLLADDCTSSISSIVMLTPIYKSVVFNDKFYLLFWLTETASLARVVLKNPTSRWGPLQVVGFLVVLVSVSNRLLWPK